MRIVDLKQNRENDKDNKYNIRLEYCFPDMEENKRSYVDIAVFDESAKECALIELKYKTEARSVIIDGEMFNLMNQSARDYGSYAVLSDLSRLEGKLGDCVRECVVKQIHSIFLTNDKKYQTGFKRGLFINFGLAPGKINSPLCFNLPKNKTQEETCAKGFKELSFKYQYEKKWDKYSEYLDCLILSKTI